MKKPMIVGIAGGSGSGKTLVANTLGQALGAGSVILPMDAYYLDQVHLPFEERAKVNYDHPDAFDYELLLSHIDMLKAGKEVPLPQYNYTTHTRQTETVPIGPGPVIILEGILALSVKALRESMDVKIFVDTDADVRFIRRLKRDTRERGRSLESVVDQYMDVVRLMHLEFVEPSKRYADIIVPEGGYNHVAIDFITTKLKSLLV